MEKPKELYDKILNSMDAKAQTGEEIFSFLRNLAAGDAHEGVQDSQFKIPLKLTPEFDVGIFSYIYRMKEENFTLYVPDVVLSLNGTVLKPESGRYTLKPGLVKIKYGEQVYTIIATRAEP